MNMASLLAAKLQSELQETLGLKDEYEVDVCFGIDRLTPIVQIWKKSVTNRLFDTPTAETKVSGLADELTEINYRLRNNEPRVEWSAFDLEG